MKVLICYYSTYGNVYKMANLVAEGVSQVAGAEPVIRTVPELIPAAVIDPRADMKAGRGLQKDIPLVTADDFREAGAIAFGTPTRFGNVSSQLKNQIDQLSPLWLKGELEGKPAGVFVSTGSLHGGQETTILTLMAPLLHLGMILVGVPYSVQELFATQGEVHPTGRVIWLGETTGAELTRTRRPFAAPWVAGWQKSDCGCKRGKAATRTHSGSAPATTRNEDTTMTVETPVKPGTRDGQGKAPKPLPAPNSDFYQLADTLKPAELAIVKQVRAFMETKVAPIINKYWIEDSFPFELLPAFKELNLGGLGMQGYGCRGGSALLFGLAAMEMSRVDSSIATFFGVHNGLAMGSIYAAGSEEQKKKWLPPMARFEKIGCFGLTEPLVGSGASGGLTTTAKREGDTWVLNGQKKWIGNSPWCDLSVIWARDVADNQVKGFIVENKTTPGFSVEKIQNKIALKVVQNGLITLKDVRVPEENHLQAGKSFRDTARVLRMTRYLVAWEATGCQMGAYEHALKYAQERLQFGRPIGSFQLVQDLLARMLANVTACQCLVVRTAQLHAEGKLGDHHAALSKAFCTAKMRETVAWAREILGGNGISTDYDVARFFADAEALYSYEGTFQMQNLIVGKAITGLSAFV